MDELILITGANGHLGRVISQMLIENQRKVRGLVLPGDNVDYLNKIGLEIVFGDVTDTESLKPLFAGAENKRIVIIHTAGIIDIVAQASPLMNAVNVGGTKNMVNIALEYNVNRFIYISSVHAITEKPDREVIFETKNFSADSVVGGYAKTKAEATAFVMDSIENRSLPGLILHPSGVLGPGNSGNNHIVAVIKAYMEKRLPASIKGGYNLVDVRDVAMAVISAIDKGRIGETYILAGHHCEVPYILKTVSIITGNGPRSCPAIPRWLALLAAGFIEIWARRKKQRPLFSKYAVDTLGTNDNFSHAKAGAELDFHPRNIFRTLEDTIEWLEKN